MPTTRSTGSRPSLQPHDDMQGRRRDQAELSSNISAACFIAMAAMIALSALLGG